jgi:hypothetical protein
VLISFRHQLDTVDCSRQERRIPPSPPKRAIAGIFGRSYFEEGGGAAKSELVDHDGLLPCPCRQQFDPSRSREVPGNLKRFELNAGTLRTWMRQKANE